MLMHVNSWEVHAHVGPHASVTVSSMLVTVIQLTKNNLKCQVPGIGVGTEEREKSYKTLES